MVQNVNPTFVKTPNRGVAVISTGSGTSVVTLYTGGANGSKVTGVNIIQNSTATINFILYVSNSGTNYEINQVTVASNTPASLVTSAPGLPLDSDGNPHILLASSADTLSVQAQTTLPTATAAAGVYAVAGDF